MTPSRDVAWRIVPLHHLTRWQRVFERIFGGSFLWCPEVTRHREWTRQITRAGRRR